VDHLAAETGEDLGSEASSSSGREDRPNLATEPGSQGQMWASEALSTRHQERPGLGSAERRDETKDKLLDLFRQEHNRNQATGRGASRRPLKQGSIAPPQSLQQLLSQSIRK